MIVVNSSEPEPHSPPQRPFRNAFWQTRPSRHIQPTGVFSISPPACNLPMGAGAHAFGRRCRVSSRMIGAARAKANGRPTPPEAAIARDPAFGAEMLVAEWEPATTAPFLEVVSRVAVRDRAIDFTTPSAAEISASERALYLRATELIPTDGIVKETSRQIVKGAANDFDKARLIYDWVVANTVRNPRTRGCGSGDIGAMLRTGDTERQMRRHQRPFCWARPRRRPARTRSLRIAHRAVAIWLEEPRRQIRRSSPRRSIAEPKCF